MLKVRWKMSLIGLVSEPVENYKENPLFRGRGGSGLPRARSVGLVRDGGEIAHLVSAVDEVLLKQLFAHPPDALHIVDVERLVVILHVDPPADAQKCPLSQTTKTKDVAGPLSGATPRNTGDEAKEAEEQGRIGAGRREGSQPCHPPHDALPLVRVPHDDGAALCVVRLDPHGHDVVPALDPELLVNLKLDREAVAVPPPLALDAEPVHVCVARDDVLRGGVSSKSGEMGNVAPLN